MPEATVRVASVLVALVVATSGCGGGPSAAAVAPAQPSGRMRPLVGGVTVPIGPELTSLPSGARFAWVVPRSLLRNLKEVDERDSRSGAVLVLASDVTTLLLSHGWREVPPDSADYHLTIARVDRRDVAPVGQAIARRSVELPSCRPFGGESRKVNCTSTPLSQGTEHGAGLWYTYVIRRRGDSAMRAWAFPLDWDSKATDHGFVRPTLELLLAGAH